MKIQIQSVTSKFEEAYALLARLMLGSSLLIPMTNKSFIIVFSTYLIKAFLKLREELLYSNLIPKHVFPLKMR